MTAIDKALVVSNVAIGAVLLMFGTQPRDPYVGALCLVCALGVFVATRTVKS